MRTEVTLTAPAEHDLVAETRCIQGSWTSQLEMPHETPAAPGGKAGAPLRPPASGTVAGSGLTPGDMGLPAVLPSPSSLRGHCVLLPL